LYWGTDSDFQKAPLKEEELKAFEKRKHISERVFVCMVAVGVTMELIMVPISLHETAQLFERITQADERTAEAKKQAAELKVISSSNELALTHLKWRLEQVRGEQSPRELKLIPCGLNELLQGKVTGECAIWYMPDDVEAHGLALGILGRLSAAGWKLSGLPEPIPSNKVVPALQTANPLELQKLPLIIRATGSVASISIISRIIASRDDSTNPASVLATALSKCGFMSFSYGTDESFPSDKVLLIIGPKP